MSVLFKRYTWVVNLVALTLLALVVAGAVGDVFRAALFVAPRPPAPVVQVAEPPGERAALGRVDSAEDVTAALIERRSFNLAGPPPPTAPALPATPKEEPRPALIESKLPIDLMGTLVAAGGDYSYATVRVHGKPRVARIGRKLMDGKATVVRIAPGHILLREHGEGYTYVLLRGEEDAAAPPAKPPVPARPAATGLRGGVTMTGPDAYTVDRDALRHELADAAQVKRQARSVSSFRGSQYQGVRLMGVRSGTALRRLGIRSGDVVVSVGGRPLPVRDGATVLLQQLAGASSQVQVEILRRGQPKTLTYQMR